MLRTVSCFMIISLVTVSAASAADGWGSVSGKILWKGEIPKPALLHGAGADIKNAEVCAVNDTYSDELLVDEKTKGIANVFIYLPRKPKKIHPDLKDFDPQVIFDQKNCVFIPHALLVRAGQSVEVLNSDSISHNTHTYPIRNNGENVIVNALTPKGKGKLFATKSSEILPTKVVCDLHAWMKAYWLILDHPYAAVSSKDGTFEIKDLPEGKHKLRLWHEVPGYLERSLTVTVKGGEVTELKPLEYEFETKD